VGPELNASSLKQAWHNARGVSQSFRSNTRRFASRPILQSGKANLITDLPRVSKYVRHDCMPHHSPISPWPAFHKP